MEIAYYRAPHLNFGDDLNAYIWEQVLPPSVLNSDLILIGIGSILAEWFVGRYAESGKRIAVMGSGTSYGRPPVDMSGWHIGALRGPMTAAVVEHPEAAVTDGAILLAATRLARRSPNPAKIIFMPHHKSLYASRWDEIAESAGLEYVSPRTPVPDVLAKFANAKLVVTEAMHGAIVADTMRIPWIPVALSPRIEEFKWRDWTRSLNMPYAPVLISASTSNEYLRSRSIRRDIESRGIEKFPALGVYSTKDEYLSYLSRRFNERSPTTKQANSTPSAMRRAFKASVRVLDPAFAYVSAKALSQAAASESFLSEDAVFADRLERMQHEVRRLEHLV